MFAYDLTLVIHVIAAIYLIGNSLSALRLQSAVRAATARGELHSFLTFLIRLTRLNPLVALVLLGTGIYLGAAGWWTAGWFYVAAGAWLANSLLAVLVVGRTEGVLLEAAGRSTGDGIDGELEALRGRRSWKLGESIKIANDLAMVWVMYAKPGLAGSILAVALFNGAVLALALLPRPVARRAAESAASA